MCPTAQLGFNEFLTRCEVLDFDVDGRAIAPGRMTMRDIARMKVPPPPFPPFPPAPSFRLPL